MEANMADKNVNEIVPNDILLHSKTNHHERSFFHQLIGGPQSKPCTAQGAAQKMGRKDCISQRG